MRLLVDAQLPRRLAHRLRASGHDVLHTLDLPRGNRSPDAEIVALARRDGRVLVAKDADFVREHVLTGAPALLLLSVGNCANAELEALLLPRWPAIARAFEAHAFVEVTRTAIVVHA